MCEGTKHCSCRGHIILSIGNVLEVDIEKRVIPGTSTYVYATLCVRASSPSVSMRSVAVGRSVGRSCVRKVNRRIQSHENLHLVFLPQKNCKTVARTCTVNGRGRGVREAEEGAATTPPKDSFPSWLNRSGKVNKAFSSFFRPAIQG